MTTATRTAWRPRWALAFLAAAVAVLVAVFGAAPASAVTATTTQNAVGASTSTADVVVGPSSGISAGQRLGNDPPQPGIVVATGVAAETAVGPTEVAFGPAPENAWTTFERVQAKGSPLPGYKGGSAFANDGRAGSQVLPKTTGGGDPITYQEWDVNPYVKGLKDRGTERIVTGNDGSAYYTSDHYRSFTQFWSGG